MGLDLRYDEGQTPLDEDEKEKRKEKSGERNEKKNGDFSIKEKILINWK